MVKNKKRHTSQIGTKIYMAPEMKNSNYSLPVDIYSLGLVDVLIFKALALGLELPYWFKILTCTINHHICGKYINVFFSWYFQVNGVYVLDPLGRDNKI